MYFFTPDEMREIELKAIDTYGIEAQLWMVIEEMSELSKEICKDRRGKGNPEHLAEEIADALIMLDQLVLIFNNRERVFEYVNEKIGRLKQRLEGSDESDEGVQQDENHQSDLSGNP